MCESGRIFARKRWVTERYPKQCIRIRRTTRNWVRIKTAALTASLADVVCGCRTMQNYVSNKIAILAYVV
jgi:hypothetical protein